MSVRHHSTFFAVLTPRLLLHRLAKGGDNGTNDRPNFKAAVNLRQGAVVFYSHAACFALAMEFGEECANGAIDQRVWGHLVVCRLPHPSSSYCEVMHLA